MEVHHNDDMIDVSSTCSAVDEFKTIFEDWAKVHIPASKPSPRTQAYSDQS
jgi:hypothetical protein